ncbi:MAG: hypothetical protein IVW57_16740 [Ktedonobacterales bacterium]|nr:hypothetical protein [Ktedonobacterales bacterium]
MRTTFGDGGNDASGSGEEERGQMKAGEPAKPPPRRRGRSAARQRTTSRGRQRGASGQRQRARPADVPATTRAPLSGAAAPWRAGAHAASGPTPALELTAPTGAGPSDVILELVGAESGALRTALSAWQREQDRQANRAWRRPGGLARPAGL